MAEIKKALIFDIQRFSLHDGPGIRTLVFFKGCSLACKWCSNPEGISAEPEIQNNRRICVKCGTCVRGCPAGAVRMGENGVCIDRKICIRCGACIENCPTHALSWWGKLWRIEDIYKEVCRDIPFYNSGGGVTLGGGDPMLQNEQAVGLLKMCREHEIDTAIETAGNYPWEYLENAAPYCNTIHFDLKAWNTETFKRCAGVGVDNHTIMDNLKHLDHWIGEAENKPKLIVRIPLIPDFNYTLEDFRGLAAFLPGLKSLTGVEILPFHNLGEHKYAELEREYTFQGSNNLKAEAVEAYESVLQQAKIPVAITTI